MAGRRVLSIIASPYLPDQPGGAVRSTEAFLKAVRADGDAVAVAGHPRVGRSHGALWSRARLKLSRSGVYRDRLDGYDVYRCGRVALAAEVAIREFRPTHILLHHARLDQLAPVLNASGAQILAFLHMADMGSLGVSRAVAPQIADWAVVAPSQFVAEAFREAAGFDPLVLYPPVRADDYRTDPGDKVLVLTTEPGKGGHYALKIAEALPEAPFLVIGGRGRQRPEARMLAALPNVEYHDWADMRETYGKTKLALVLTGTPLPDGRAVRLREASPRVVTEAQVSGIPSIVAKEGGCVEKLHGGGMAVSVHAPLADWVEAVRRGMTDAALYDQWSTAARAAAERPEFDHDAIMARFLGLLDDGAA